MKEVPQDRGHGCLQEGEAEQTACMAGLLAGRASTARSASAYMRARRAQAVLARALARWHYARGGDDDDGECEY